MKRLLLLAAVVAALGLVSVNGRASAAGTTESFTLYAGQNIAAGTVDVSNDATNLYVTFNLSGDWCMTESHVAVATDPSGIPQTKTGNPIPGQFPYQHSYGSCVTTDTYTIPLDTWTAGTSLDIAAHAALFDTATYAVESGWAGSQDFSGKNWATYFSYTVEDHWSISLAINPSSVVAGSGGSVTFTGTLSNAGPTSVVGQDVTINAYSTDSTCSGTPSWHFYGTTGAGGAYSIGPKGATAGPGNYYYTASSNGAVSGCEYFTITPAATGDITLDESGGSSLTFSVWFPHQGSAGYVHGSLGYTASPTCVHTYNGDTVVFEYQIPAGPYSQAGLWVVWKLTVGSTTAGYSYTATQSTADGWCADSSFSPAHNYTITSATVPVTVY